MDYQIKANDGAIPCEVTIDPDNGRYTIRKSDTSGEVFNSESELTQWIAKNWDASMFEDPQQFQLLMDSLPFER
ncbi:hypothetical protein [Alteribacter populi]|uniref:hypothetical protein n=1 Tax=Alteribacter populi TaxID=2011011 RepID=UPI000BBAAE70|nr:hypothetical protein [Alteribacter populi]